MGKPPLLLLLLLLVLYSLMSFLQALTCHQCRHINAKGVCERGKGVCKSHGWQRCFLKKVYEANTMLYGQQGCSSVCAPFSLINLKRVVKFQCCKNKDLCNWF